MAKVLILVFAALSLSACILVPEGHGDGDRDGHEHHDDRDDHRDHHE